MAQFPSTFIADPEDEKKKKNLIDVNTSPTTLVLDEPEKPKSLWEQLSTPPEFITNAAHRFGNFITNPNYRSDMVLPLPIPGITWDELRGFIGGASEAASGLLSPINVGMSAIGAGEGAAVRAGLPALAKTLGIAQKGLSIPFAYEGAENIINQPDILGKLAGIGEFAGGVAGLAAPIHGSTKLEMPKVELKPEIKPEIKSEIKPEIPEIPTTFKPDPLAGFQDIEMMARTDKGIKIGADVGSLGKVLGSSLYQGDIRRIATKELMQNSIDATRHLGPEGRVSVDIGDDYISVADNGKGLTRDELETVFTDLGSSGKRNDAEAVGGFGLAKAAPLLGGKKVEVKTVAVEPNGQKFEHSFSGTPEELLEGVNVDSIPVPPDTPTGTHVKTFVPSDVPFYDTRQFIENVRSNSHGYQGRIVGDGYSPLSEARPAESFKDANVITLDSPGAEISIIVPKHAKYGEGLPKAKITNNGMYQGEHVFSWTKVPNIPDHVVADIRSKVPEGHPDYPFTANRETLRGSALDVLDKHYQEAIVQPGLNARIKMLKQAYHGMPEMSLPSKAGPRKFFVYDVGKRFSKDELTEIMRNPVAQRLASSMAESIHSIFTKLPSRTAKEWGDQLQKIGFIFDDRLRGIHIPAPGEKASAILVNPFTIMKDVAGPDQTSAGIFHTILHEIAHIPGGGHDESFAIRLADIHQNLGARRALQIQDEFLGILADPRNPTEYKPEIHELLQRYTESRRRAQTEDDALYRTGIGSKAKSEGPEGTPGNSGKRRANFDATVEKLLFALKEAKPIREEQELSYSAERSERIQRAMKVKNQGETGYYKMLQQLKGPMEKYQFESIRPQLSKQEVDYLFKTIRQDKSTSPYEKIHAMTGLAKLLGEFGGHVPQRGELTLLDKVFGSGFGKEIMEMHSGLGVIAPNKLAIADLTNAAKTLMSSIDLSAPLRQGIGLVHRGEFWKSFLHMFKMMGSQKAYDATMKSISEMETAPLAQTAGLKLSSMDGPINAREDAFISHLLHRVPGVGSLLRGSERAYSGFLNKLRADTFESLAKNALASKMEPNKLFPTMEMLADYVNNATGRGSLGALDKHAAFLNNFFFSPRLIASRLNMLNPTKYVNNEIPWAVKKEYIKSLLAIMSLGTTVTQIGRLAGGKVETDPRSADFGKIRFGNTRLDPWGGFQQYVVAGTRLATGQSISTTNQHLFNLGEKYGSPTRKDILYRFVEGKSNPAISLALILLNGKDYAGQPVNVNQEIADRFIPMFAHDVYELWKEDPSLLPLSIPAGFGMGLQTYSNEERLRTR